MLAWVVPDFEVVKQRRSDLGERPEMKEVKIPKAAVWLKRGTKADIEKAKAYAEKETDYKIAVLMYPTSERDPIGKAKRDVLEIMT